MGHSRGKPDLEKDQHVLDVLRESGSSMTAQELASKFHTTDSIIRTVARSIGVEPKRAEKKRSKRYNQETSLSPVQKFLMQPVKRES